MMNHGNSGITIYFTLFAHHKHTVEFAVMRSTCHMSGAGKGNCPTLFGVVVLPHWCCGVCAHRVLLREGVG